MFSALTPPAALSSRKLREHVAAHRPELIPLFKLFHKADNSQQPWEMETPVDAVKLSTFLHSKMLLSPELNRNSPCYIARRIVQLYIKLMYIATFPPHEIDEYGSLGDQEYDEVRMVRYLLHNGQPSFDVEHIYRLAAMLGISYHADLWNDVMKFVTCALPFAEHTESLLVRGSDDRSILDPATKTNKYNTSTIPPVHQSQAWISRASCTSSSISLDQFTVCEAQRQELLLASLSINNDNIRDIFDRKMHNVRVRLADCLGLRSHFDDHDFQAIISPSGTDAELLATSVALARLESIHTDANPLGTVTTIVTAQGEIGRGSVPASSGQHFSQLTPSGEAVEVGAPLCAFPSARVRCTQVPARHEDGSVVDADAITSQAVHDALASNPNNVALLHVVMGSKTGLSCPSLHAVHELVSTYGTRLVIVIDACQMRLDRGALVDFIQRGYVVLVTGSKFFAGVPFCGSVLVPAQSVYELNVADPSLCFPAGYAAYFTKFEFPPFCMQNVRAVLPTRMNVGLLLRWETALVHMEVYASIPPAMVAQISHEYIGRAKSMLATHTHVALLDPFDAPAKALKPKPPVSADTGLPIQPLDTIVSFHVVDGANGFLSLDKLKVVHLLLSKDISSVVASTNEVALAQKKCLVGQPVSLGKLPYGVLRIALGADMVNHIFQGTKTMSELVLEDAIILRKIELILNHWDALCARFVHVPTASPMTLPAASIDTSQSTPTSSRWNFSAKSSHCSSVVQHLVEECLVAAPRTILYDLDAVDMAFQALMAPFPPHFEQRFAVGACPLSFFLRRAIENDVGLTCTTIVEVHHALRLGCAPHKIVFTAPHKSPSDIADAINAGVEVNADSFEELDIIKAHAQQRFQSNFPECTPRYAGELPRIGLRVHACLHTAAPKWCTGISLTKPNRAKLVQAFHDNPWITGLAVACCADCPAGVSSMQQLAHGARVICDLAKEIDATVGEDRVKVLNLGGRGLTANFESDDVSPTLAEFVDVLKHEAPSVLERSNGRTIVTEYGSYVSAKVGWTLHQVDCIREAATDDDVTNTIVVRADSAFFTTRRTHTSTSEPTFQHRVSVFKSDGLTSTAKDVAQQVVSFMEPGATDAVCVRPLTVPKLERGDFLVVHDTGAMNNVDGAAVYGYRHDDDEIKVVLLKPAHTLEQAMQLWS
ncbi:hypothetical protein H310_07156 [Aphanomyces invadans]|uniref:Orn/DAP/Arg decarboxylase 2 N-terminal domain-containing protein n=1 Tax=Aphanomyces invadans TaxID=157072 RepID=A0A024U2X3_9STRA|nr:hypothetical protein H310_07156 [Aphanomyces invadans]ETW00575.1 hypothetical protein H310_07156 [Aphanomyces invadans]|eukprot:XP_008870710.1 hypothetical protein H310_07156 [Aphanomyces invadans]